jgi:hypothetical protein
MGCATSSPTPEGVADWAPVPMAAAGLARQAMSSLENEKAACEKRIRKTAELMDSVESCAALIREATDQLDRVRRWRKAQLSPTETAAPDEPERNKKTAAAVDELELKATSAQESGSRELADRKKELPLVPLGRSSLSLSLQAFVGLMRISFGKTSEGKSDEIHFLSGVGTGVKLRWDGYDHDNRRFEIIGANLGVFLEPTTSGMDQSGGSLRGSVSALLVLSTYEHLYVGAGMRFASTENGYVRGFNQENFLMVLGFGADGKSL